MSGPVKPTLEWRALAAAGLVLLLAASDVLAKPPAASAPIAGTVTRVIDGDTLVFTPTGQASLTVRLRDIDAPEICQEGGEASRRLLSDLALNKPAVLQTFARDSYGRTVGTVQVDDVNLGPRMVEEGQAWSQRTRFDQGPLVKQERMAKALGRGFHTQAGKVMPWDFRKAHGSCVEGQGAAAPPPKQ